jgi:hypothetical protein
LVSEPLSKGKGRKIVCVLEQSKDVVLMIFIYRRKLGKLGGVYKGFVYKIW